VTSEPEISFDDFFGETGESVNSCDQSQAEFRPIHPMDLQMAILSCADDFVKRYLFTKLATCHYALPILVPSVRNSRHSSIYGVVETSKYSCHRHTAVMSSSGEEGSSEMSKPLFSLCGVEQAKVPLVSFIRLSSSTVSKSQLLNLILNGKKHHTFFNRNCVGCSEYPLSMNGVTEITWYCPSGKEGDTFDRCIAFTNLHGNALDHRRQIEFLDKISTVNVVLMSEAERNNPAVKELLTAYLASSKPLIVMQTDQPKQKGLQKALREKVKIPLMNRNEAELAREITDEITRLISTVKSFPSLEDCAQIASDMGFIVDEEQGECKH
jgi:hypothetical protein